jgi:hypothetical protein
MSTFSFSAPIPATFPQPATPALTPQPLPPGVPGASLQQALQGSSFTFEDTQSRPRLVMSVEGLDGCGKTYFAMTAPSKRGQLYMGTDIGREGVIEQFERRLRSMGRVFGKAEYALTIPNGSGGTAIQEIAQRVWGIEARDYEVAVRAGASSIIVDTATEIYSHLTLARFGKLSEVPQHLWGILSQEYMNLMRQAFNSDTSVVLIHKQKKEYKGKNATGQMVRAGFNDTNYLVQVSVLLFKFTPGEPVDPMYWQQGALPGLEDKLVQQIGQGGLPMVTVNQKVFLGKILKCRHKTELEGMTLVNPNFPTIAKMVMPEVDPAAWD